MWTKHHQRDIAQSEQGSSSDYCEVLSVLLVLNTNGHVSVSVGESASVQHDSVSLKVTECDGGFLFQHHVCVQLNLSWSY